MRVGSCHVDERHARAGVFAVLLVWAVVIYVRGVLHSSPAPAPHGAGLAVVVLNVVTFALLATGLRIGHWKGRRWRAPGTVLLLAAMGTSLSLYGVSPHGGGVWLSMVGLWVLVTRLPLPAGLAVATAAVVSIGLIGAAFRDGGSDLGVMAAFMGLTLGALATRQGMIAQEATRRAEAASTALAERSRIAREIHDILAHSLSAQIVHLEGARLLLSRDGDRVQALDRVERARRLARSGLDETRRALAALRGELPEPKEVIAELAEEFRASTGRPCEVQVLGTPRELPPQAGLAVARTAQEALTNVRKHAPGARARVVLRYLDDTVELEVTDTGATEPVVNLGGGGYGLVGMRERAELFDGTLETGPDGEGFRVSLRVPVQDGAL
ncbi:sensor histidine kinase [Spirillospora albida]|uniref:sensor histidine kinase n=1 Tax=Spirillospora albida TaxID=58123 RepID=UPI000ADD50DF|nr:histidine kinase [Spirillospora albida]